MYLISDTFQLFYMNSSKKVPVNLSYTDIAWDSDRNVKFQNPKGDLKAAFSKYSKPRDWQRPVYDLDTSDKDDNGFRNEDFIVWMRTAAFSTFRKLYRKVVQENDFKDGLPKGDYKLSISFSIL
jgi:hypothetical protein